MRRLPQYWPWLLLASLCTGSFALSCHLAGSLGLSPDAGDSVADLLFGRARGAFGRRFYETADQYFHKGVPHESERGFEDTPFQRLLGEIVPNEVEHLEGDEVSEMMPWLWLSIRMDPKNIEVYRVAAFWLASNAGRADLAHDVLLKAHLENPQNYQVRLDMGRMALKEQDWERAAKDLDAALRLWPSREGIDEELADLERGEILLHRALLYEAEGQIEESKQALRTIAAIFPDRELVTMRLQRLEEGREPPVSAEQLLIHLHEAHVKRMSACEHHDRHEHEREDEADGHVHSGTRGHPH